MFNSSLYLNDEDLYGQLLTNVVDWNARLDIFHWHWLNECKSGIHRVLIEQIKMITKWINITIGHLRLHFQIIRESCNKIKTNWTIRGTRRAHVTLQQFQMRCLSSFMDFHFTQLLLMHIYWLFIFHNQNILKTSLNKTIITWVRRRASDGTQRRKMTWL